jgi:hypothetical protein
MLQKMADVRLATREKVVEADNVVPLGKQPLTQMRSEKATAASYQNCLCHNKSR